MQNSNTQTPAQILLACLQDGQGSKAQASQAKTLAGQTVQGLLQEGKAAVLQTALDLGRSVDADKRQGAVHYYKILIKKEAEGLQEAAMLEGQEEQAEAFAWFLENTIGWKKSEAVPTWARKQAKVRSLHLEITKVVESLQRKASDAASELHQMLINADEADGLELGAVQGLLADALSGKALDRSTERQFKV